jgi:hypothetical protein
MPRGKTIIGRVPPEHLSHAPPERRAGKVPNPRRVALVRHVDGGGLNDLFVFFRDLPFVRRPWRRRAAPHVRRLR